MPASHTSQTAGYSSMQSYRKEGYGKHYPINANESNFPQSQETFQYLEKFSNGGVCQVGDTPLQFCTLDSSVTSGNTVHSSSAILDFSSTSGSPSYQECQSENTCGSPIGDSCLTEDPNDLKMKLRELEIAMLGPEPDIPNSFHDSDSQSTPPEYDKWTFLNQIPRGDLKQTLVACARAISDDNMIQVRWLVEELEGAVSVSGDPLQRLGAYLMEGLKARLESSGSSIYKALKCKEPLSSELRSYMHLLYEACPYFKFGYMSANGAIAEAVKGERRVHIIDFQIAMGTQWMTLIQALAASPGGPPQLRITGIDDPISAYARGGGLEIVGKRLHQIASQFNVPFEFNAAAIAGCEVKAEDLDIRSGEVLAVNFAYQLHHIPDESVSTWNHRDRLIRMVKSFNPRVVTLVELESNTNTSPFVPRFIETLDYYTAMFESIDATTLSREDKNRISVEQHCLARDIVNIIACEGAERVERHELLGKWKLRFSMAGFKPYPLSHFVNKAIKSLLEKYNENFRLEEKDGSLYLGWKSRVLVTSCAWC